MENLQELGFVGNSRAHSRFPPESVLKFGGVAESPAKGGMRQSHFHAHPEYTLPMPSRLPSKHSGSFTLQFRWVETPLKQGTSLLRDLGCIEVPPTMFSLA